MSPLGKAVLAVGAVAALSVTASVVNAILWPSVWEPAPSEQVRGECDAFATYYARHYRVESKERPLPFNQFFGRLYLTTIEYDYRFARVVCLQQKGFELRDKTWREILRDFRLGLSS